MTENTGAMETLNVESLGVFGNESFFLLKSGKMSGSRWKAVNKRLFNVKIITRLIISNRLKDITEDKM